MRVRTAVGITAAIITAQATVAWFAAKAWLAIPQRQCPPNRWHLELGNVSEALAAVAAAGAAFIALSIAGRDRRDRNKERLDEERTVARLVLLTIEPSGRPVISVKVRNFGALPVLDVKVTDATWSEHRNARWRAATQGRGGQSILRSHQSDRPYEEMMVFDIEFLHPTEDETLVPVAKEFPGGQKIYAKIDPSKVVIKVQFTTANGIRWETPTKGEGTGETVRV